MTETCRLKYISHKQKKTHTQIQGGAETIRRFEFSAMTTRL